MDVVQHRERNQALYIGPSPRKKRKPASLTKTWEPGGAQVMERDRARREGGSNPRFKLYREASESGQFPTERNPEGRAWINLPKVLIGPLNPASIKLQEPVIGGRAQIKRRETPMINKRARARAKSRALATRETRILEVGPTRRARKKTRDTNPNPWNTPTR